jgi:hypothetical protein
MDGIPQLSGIHRFGPRPRPMVPVVRNLVVVCAALVLSGSLVPVSPSLAASSAGNHHSDTDSARALVKEASELQQQGALAPALEKLQRAYELVPTPTLLWPIAELALALTRPVEGLQALHGYRRLITPDQMAPGQQQQDIERLQRRLRAQAAQLQLRAKAGTNLVIDGKAVGKAPLAEAVLTNPGEHRVEAVTSQGIQRRTVAATEGSVVEIDFTAAATDKAAVSSVPTVAGDTIVGSPAPYHPSLITWAAIGLSSAVLTAASLSGATALARTQSLQSLCPGRTCIDIRDGDIATLNEKVTAQRTASTVSYALWGTGAALAVATSIWTLCEWRKQLVSRDLPRSTAWRVLPLLDVSGSAATQVGLQLGGRF